MLRSHPLDCARTVASFFFPHTLGFALSWTLLRQIWLELSPLRHVRALSEQSAHVPCHGTASILPYALELFACICAANTTTVHLVQRAHCEFTFLRTLGPALSCTYAALFNPCTLGITCTLGDACFWTRILLDARTLGRVHSRTPRRL